MLKQFISYQSHIAYGMASLFKIIVVYFMNKIQYIFQIYITGQ